MERWIDGRMKDEWNEGWKEGWQGGWMDGWMDGWMERWMEAGYSESGTYARKWVLSCFKDGRVPPSVSRKNLIPVPTGTELIQGGGTPFFHWKMAARAGWWF